MNVGKMKQIMAEILDLLEEGVHVIDKKGTTLFYNKAMSSIEHMDRESVLRRHFHEAFSHIPADESTLLRALERGQLTWRRNQEYLNEFGNRIHTVNSTVPLMIDGEVFCAVEVSKNVTDFMNMSKAIIDLKTNHGPGAQAARGGGVRKYTFADILGNSRAMSDAIAMAHKAAESGYNVLISGETGTGKEMFAQSIHYSSPRSDKPFLAQNCAALPESLLESILFGTVKGSFTGAIDRSGLFVQAGGGTLLLDEISSMPYRLQSKLLRVIQEQCIRPIGGSSDIPIDVRIIATINEPAEKLIGDGRLRSDLYYRLNVVNLDILPLRDRKEDIAVLADAFLLKHSGAAGKNLRIFSDESIDKLMSYDYPGNVRELENVIISAVTMSGDEYMMPAQSIVFRPPDKGGAAPYDFDGCETLPEYIDSVETAIIDSALEKYGGNYTKTAGGLGINRQALQYKLNKRKRKGE